MPSVSKKQHNLMAAVASNPKFAKKVGIPQSVGMDFMEADKGKKFRKGGTTNPAKAKIANPRPRHGEIQLPNVSLKKYGFNNGGVMKESKAMMQKEVSFMKKKGAPKSMIKHEMAEAKGMKYGGMAKGGMSECKTVAKKEVKAHEKRMHKMAAGGKAGQLSKADGVAMKGKTKGTMVKMNYGGKC